jgi:hypothetical protein
LEWSGAANSNWEIEVKTHFSDRTDAVVKKDGFDFFSHNGNDARSFFENFRRYVQTILAARAGDLNQF